MNIFSVFINFIKMIVARRNLIREMVVREIASQYVGSWLGFIWTIINPLIMILIFWFVFGFGLKAQPLKNVPFVVWLTAGMAVWFNFSEILSGATVMVTNNPHLVKKILFPCSILPVVKIFSSLVSHIIFLLLLFILIVSYGLPINGWFILQGLYYYAAMIVLVMGLAWLTSALNVFIRDTTQIVQVGLQIAFWGTPIFWDIHIMPPVVQQILKLNPVFYLVQGYRDSFIYAVPFWVHWRWSCYYWLVSGALLFIGALVFHRLKPHFADVI